MDIDSFLMEGERLRLSKPQLKTQKAKGILALREFWPKLSLPVMFCKGLSDVVNLPPFYPLFVRPCPIRPRHGFVESRACNDTLEVIGVLIEAKKQDSEAELSCSRFVDASHNMVLSDSVISVGKGNSGATSGMESIEFPLEHVRKLYPQFLKEAAITDTPYLEWIKERNGPVFCTQLRDGPKLGLKDTTSTMKVEKVLVAEGSLLQWEARLNGLTEEDKKGLVIFHPGGNSLSHYSIHAHLHNIPVVYGDKAPEIGASVLAKEPIEKSSLPVLRFIFPCVPNPQELKAAICAIQQGYKMLHNPLWAKVISYSLSVILAAATASVIKELVYGDVVKKSFGGFESCGVKEKKEFFYTWACEASPNPEYLLEMAHNLYADKIQWHGEFGGKRWKEATRKVCQLHNALFNNSFLEAIKCSNELISLEHNTSIFFSSFLGRTTLDDISNGEPYTIAEAAAFWYDWCKGEESNRPSLPCSPRKVKTRAQYLKGERQLQALVHIMKERLGDFVQF